MNSQSVTKLNLINNVGTLITNPLGHILYGDSYPYRLKSPSMRHHIDLYIIKSNFSSKICYYMWSSSNKKSERVINQKGK